MGEKYLETVEVQVNTYAGPRSGGGGVRILQITSLANHVGVPLSAGVDLLIGVARAVVAELHISDTDLAHVLLILSRAKSPGENDGT